MTRSIGLYAALLVLAFVSRASADNGATATGDLAIPMDESRIVSFDRSVTTVFVSNPSVADVNMIDGKHVFILGKAFGSTNLIALDAAGNTVTNRHVAVFGSGHLVTLNRGPNQFTFACATERCETAPAPGDVRKWHDDGMDEAEKREDFGGKQASPNEGH